MLTENTFDQDEGFKMTQLHKAVKSQDGSFWKALGPDGGQRTAKECFRIKRRLSKIPVVMERGKNQECDERNKSR